MTVQLHFSATELEVDFSLLCPSLIINLLHALDQFLDQHVDRHVDQHLDQRCDDRVITISAKAESSVRTRWHSQWLHSANK
jgi:hypothetical protein